MVLLYWRIERKDQMYCSTSTFKLYTTIYYSYMICFCLSERNEWLVGWLVEWCAFRCVHTLLVWNLFSQNIDYNVVLSFLWKVYRKWKEQLDNALVLHRTNILYLISYSKNKSSVKTVTQRMVFSHHSIQKQIS